MKRQERKVICSFVSHVETVLKAIPCLPSDRYRPRAVNAWRIARKELARVRKILEETKDDTEQNNR